MNTPARGQVIIHCVILLGYTQMNKCAQTVICIIVCRSFSDDGTTCFMAQQLGFFEINKPSECDTPKPEFGGSTSAEMLAHAATVCCQSRKVDQMVCRVGKCVASVALCLALHNDFEDAAKKITNPKAMEMSDEGNFEGDCAAAILNRVEGALCCTTGMQLLGKCVEREVGDYKACEDSWNAAFEPTFFDKAEAIAKAFQTGGYCAPQSTSASVCPKCGTIKKSGKLSCCAPGGSWVKQCGNPGNSKFEHTWSEGIDACRSKFASVCICWSTCTAFVSVVHLLVRVFLNNAEISQRRMVPRRLSLNQSAPVATSAVSSRNPIKINSVVVPPVGVGSRSVVIPVTRSLSTRGPRATRPAKTVSSRLV